MVDINEVSEVSTEDEEEETAEGSKYNDEFNNKGRKANKAKLDCSSNLLECLLETEEQKTC